MTRSLSKRSSSKTKSKAVNTIKRRSAKKIAAITAASIAAIAAIAGGGYYGYKKIDNHYGKKKAQTVLDLMLRDRNAYLVREKEQQKEREKEWEKEQLQKRRNSL